MVAVITGDIINSRKLKNPNRWMTPLKELFSDIGNSPKTWEIYRGDSFQIEIKKPEDALLVAIHIKACMKCVNGLDVRAAIGIGKKDYAGRRITESNGEAFIYSGEKLDSLNREKRTLAVRTTWSDFDKEMNLCIKLALLVMDKWTEGSAEFVKVSIENEGMNQLEIADLLGIAQSSVSGRQRRAHYPEIMELEALFRDKIRKLAGK